MYPWENGCIMQLQKEVISIQKQPSCEKTVWPKKPGWKRCEIKGGGQEMVMMVHQWQFYNNENSGEFSYTPSEGLQFSHHINFYQEKY